MTEVSDWKTKDLENTAIDDLTLSAPQGNYWQKMMGAIARKFAAVDTKLEKVEGALVRRGEKATVEALPTTGNSIGDYWTITEDGSEWAWNGTEWYKIGRDTLNFVDLATDQSVAGAKSFAEGPYGTASAVSAAEIDLGDGVVFTKTISANTTFAISGVPTDKVATFNLLLTNGGAYTVTWPASVKWAGGTPPDLTASGLDVLTFLTPDGGSTWYGTVALEGAA